MSKKRLCAIAVLLTFQSLFVCNVRTQEVTTKINPNYNEGLRLVAKKEFTKALSTFQQAIKESPNLYRSYIKLVKHVYYELDQLDEAEAYFRELLKMDEYKAGAYYGLGLIQSQKSNSEAAIPYYISSLAIDPANTHATLYIRTCYTILGKLDELMKFAQQQRDKGLATAHEYTLLGQYYRDQGNVGKSLEAFQLAAVNGARPLYMYLQKILTLLTSDPERNKQLVFEALELAEQQDDIAYQIKFIGRIGEIYADLNDYPIALNYLDKALEMCARIEDKNNEMLFLDWKGDIYSQLGNYQMALSYYEQGHRLGKKFSAGNPNDSHFFVKIGQVYQKLGKFDQAYEFHLRGLETIGLWKEDSISVHTQLASLYKEDHDYDKALKHYRLALETSDKDKEASVLRGMGQIYHRLGDFSKALDFYQRAVITSKDFGSPRKEALVLISLGNLYGDLQNESKSEELFNQALTIGARLGEPHVIWEAYNGLALRAERMRQLARAVGYYELAISEIEKVRGQIYDEEHRSIFFARNIDVYRKVVTLLFELHTESPQESLDKKAFDYAQRMKARSMLEILANGYRLITKGIAPEVVAQKDRIEHELRRVQSSISREVARENPNQKVLDSLRIGLEGIRSNHNAVREQIIRNHPSYAALTGDISPLTLEVIQKEILTEDQVLLEYVIGDEKSLLFIVSKNAINLVAIDVNEEKLAERVIELFEPFREITNLSDIEYNLEQAHELYALLIRPAENFLDEGKHLIVVPDGILHYLPFEALVADLGKKEIESSQLYSRYAAAKYLIEKYPISYSTSASALDSRFRMVTEQSPTRGDLLAVGNPTYYSEDKGARELLRSFDWDFRPLRYSEDELRGIAALFDKKKVLLQLDATEENVKRHAPNYRILHFSAHGLLDEKQPLYSGLVLTQDDDETEDGLLQTYEIYNMDLNAELVTLSACETGLGKLRQGEGIVGLTRAFMYAGARSVLLSLWKVHDQSTTHLMKSFYEKWKGEGVSHVEALRQAKLQLMKQTAEIDAQKISYAHPFFWAPFVITGQPDLRFQSKSEMADYTWQLIGLLILTAGLVALVIKRRSVKN